MRKQENARRMVAAKAARRTAMPYGIEETMTQTAKQSTATPTLTFIVPAYNMEEYLERCVTSLLQAR